MATCKFEIKEKKEVIGHHNDPTTQFSVLSTVIDGNKVIFEKGLLVNRNRNGVFIKKESVTLIEGIARLEHRSTLKTCLKDYIRNL